jgi:hypothetical protein
VATFGSRFIRKCVAPIRISSVPNDSQTAKGAQKGRLQQETQRVDQDVPLATLDL